MAILYSVPSHQRITFVACTCIAVLSIAADFLFFNLKTAQGHLYVTFLEIVLQLAIYSVATSNGKSESVSDPKKGLVVVLLLNAIAVGYKALFVSSLADVAYLEDFSNILPLASGPAYGLRPVADGSIDIIANALYQCGLCTLKIPLEEPGITYFFAVVSMIAGEFNQHVIWLTLHVVNFLTAVVLLKTAREIFPAIRFTLLLPVLYILLSDVHGANHLLFKDGLISFALISIFYLNVRYIFYSKQERLPFELLSVLLIVSLYELRSGLLPMLIIISVINCMLDRKNMLQHVRIFFISAFISIILLNNNGAPDKLIKITKILHAKIVVGSGSYLDTENLRYTTLKEDSLPEKLQLHQITPTNFFYAPFVKASLYFLIPLPVKEAISTPDFLYKANTCFYFTLFLIFLIGIFKIISNKEQKEQYLLMIFGLCMASILGAGPMIYPRYRIIASVFFLLIVALGASRISNNMILKSIGGSAAVLTIVVLAYDDIYGLIQSIT